MGKSDLKKLKGIACNNDGIYYRIRDITDDISSIMASYYQMFVSLRNSANEESWVVWIDYLNALTGYRAISATLPVYDKTTNPHTLLGVAVAEVAAERIIDSTRSDWGNDVGIYDDFEAVFAEMMNSAKQCPTLDFSYDQLESIRSSLDNAETCESSNSSDDSGAIIIVVCVVGGLCIVILIFICWRNYRVEERRDGIHVQQQPGQRCRPRYSSVSTVIRS